MKIILAPDSYKGSLTAREVCQAMEEGILRIIPNADVISVPMADGGEGTVQSLVDATGGKIIPLTVTGPLGEKVASFFGILGDGQTAVIEMAAASGLPLVPIAQRNPCITTTYGTGELILAALEADCTKLIIGIGGSATNDGGAGAAQALGFRFIDYQGMELPFGGAALKNLARIEPSDIGQRLKNIEVIVACDVNNPLTGPNGATAVYGPQKGATPERIAELESALEHFGVVIAQDLQKEINQPGSGAAGGLGGGLVVFLGAKLKPGVDIVMETVGLAEKMKDTTLVITGEGRIDGQSVNGKTPIGVAKKAKEFKLPVLAVAGGIGPGVESVFDCGIDGITAITDHPMTLEEACDDARSLVATATERMIRIYLAGYKSNGERILE